MPGRLPAQTITAANPARLEEAGFQTSVFPRGPTRAPKHFARCCCQACGSAARSSVLQQAIQDGLGHLEHAAMPMVRREFHPIGLVVPVFQILRRDQPIPVLGVAALEWA